MKRLLLALAASLSVCVAHAAILPATPSTVYMVTKAAADGDVVQLAPGAYGDVYLARTGMGVATLTCSDPTQPPSLRSLNIAASGLTLKCLAVDFTPNASTVTWSSAITIDASDHITLSGLKITGGPAITGVVETATTLDGTGNVIGRPTARAISITHSTDVLVDGGEISRFYKGILISGTQRVTIRGANIHDIRTTAIVGSNLSNVSIDANFLHDSAPWNWGAGDHADFIAFWSDGAQTTPNDQVAITNNHLLGIDLVTPAGTPLVIGGEVAGSVLGSWLAGTATAPFTNVTYAGNRLELANLQGITLSGVHGGSVTGNVMTRTGVNPKQSPALLLREDTAGVSVSGNTLSQVSDTNPSGANAIGANTLIPDGVLPGPGPAPAPTPAPVPTPTPTPVPTPAPIPDLVINLVPGQTVKVTPGKTLKLKPGQRAILIQPK